MMRAAVAAVALAMLAAAASADIVHLKNGSKIEGKVSRDGDVIVVVRGKSAIKIPAGEVDRIEEKETPEEVYAARAKTLRDDDASGWLELGRWAVEQRLRDEPKAAFEHVLKLQPQSEEAHRALGHVLQDGKWMTRAEALEAQGYKLIDGRWLSPEEQVALKAEEERQAAIRAKIEEFTAPINDLVGEEAEKRSEARTKILARGKEFLPYLGYFARVAKAGKLRFECLKLIDEIGYEDPTYSNLIAYIAYHDSVTEVGDLAREMIKRRKDDRALLLLVKVAAADEMSSRTRAAVAIKKIGDIRAVHALVWCLSAQTSGRGGALTDLDSILKSAPPVNAGQTVIGGGVVAPAAESLELITGQEFRNDVGAWINWLRSLPPGGGAAP